MANELIINASLPETRIALMENGEIQELLIERASGKGIVGNIYKGRVTRVLPGMQAAFVDIGFEKAAFLYVDDVYVHPEIWKEHEGDSDEESEEPEESEESLDFLSTQVDQSEHVEQVDCKEDPILNQVVLPVELQLELDGEKSQEDESESAEFQNKSRKPFVEMARDPNEQEKVEGTLAPPDKASSGTGDTSAVGSEARSGENLCVENEDQIIGEFLETPLETPLAELTGTAPGVDKDAESRRHRRGKRGKRYRKRPQGAFPLKNLQGTQEEIYPERFHDHVEDEGSSDSDRSELTELIEDQNEKKDVSSFEPFSQSFGGPLTEDFKEERATGRPESDGQSPSLSVRRFQQGGDSERSEFKSHRGRDRRVRQKTLARPVRAQVNIQDLLKEGQEVLVQVGKDPIAAKGARLTCHISLPGRHLVCMPTIDHVGVSRRIEKEDERRRLREYVEKNRPRNLGFIVRTASGKQQSEKRIKQDIEYLTHLWTEIKEKAAVVVAPALVYEDLNSILRAVRDWVNEEIDKVIIDSRYYYNETLRFVSHFMPSLKQKIDLYHGDIPIFDAYGISTELSRSLERKVWLKSGGYIVIDQAEALVAIDVNTGKYVGKRNLEDTILKTNLEAVQEIAYQLRLRNCGGIIILDLIDMEKDENKQRVYRALEHALSRDRARPTILKISELGLVEMTRKRTRDTIIRTLCESCSHCEGKGFVKSKQTVAYEVMREVERVGIENDVGKILVQSHPDVIDILAIDERETLDQMERKYRIQIYLQAIIDFHPEQFEVTADKREKSRHARENENRQKSDRVSRQDQARHSDWQENRRNRTRPVVITPVGESTVVIAPVSASEQSNPFIGPEVAVSAPPKMVIQPVSPRVELEKGSQSPVVAEDLFEEEDRLAFLRAQAAQDAALARLGGAHTLRNGSDPLKGEPSSEINGRRGGARGRRGGRGNQGSRFRRGNPRNDQRRVLKPFDPPYSVVVKREETGQELSPSISETSQKVSAQTDDSESGGIRGEGGEI